MVGTLDVSGATTISALLDASAVRVRNALDISGNENLTGTLTVSGATTLRNNTDISGVLQMNNNRILFGSTAATQRITIGNYTSNASQANGTIVLNASAVDISGSTANAFYVRPIRDVSTNNTVLTSNSSSGEITWRYNNFTFPLRIDTVSTVGANNRLIPENTRFIKIRAVGAGGGGAYGAGNDTGGSGGSGGYAECYIDKTNSSLNTYQYLYINIGTGGAGGLIATTDSGAAGTSTTIYLSTNGVLLSLLVATLGGGGGGVFNDGTLTDTKTGRGGSGGTNTIVDLSNIGIRTISIDGFNGFSGISTDSATVRYPFSPTGANSVLGKGGRGANKNDSSEAGTNGGGGGAGFQTSTGPITKSAAPGGNGYAIIEYY